MGTSSSVGEFAGKFHQAAHEMRRVPRKGIEESAIAAKGIFIAELPSRTMSNVGSGAKLGASYDVKGIEHPVAMIRYTGPAHLLNNDTRAHAIYPRGLQVRTRDGGAISRSRSGRRRTARKGGAKGLTIGNDVRLYANHPGTTGKRFFQSAQPKVAAAHRLAMRDGQRRALARVFL